VDYGIIDEVLTTGKDEEVEDNGKEDAAEAEE
jgi:hypothetical protein